MATDERFIIQNKIHEGYIRYICELRYYDKPDCDWILGSVDTQKRELAMQFCESKAKILAEVLSNQEDETGYRAEYEVVKV